MDLSTIKGLYVGATPAQSVWLGGTKVWERKTAVDIQSIFDAMVLWYDPKRQGATNENMAEKPVLTDLSGNGHDATCYNFAWTENSGISSTSYPNAIVSDGVDDYAKVENVPTLNDFTIITRRTYIDGGNASFAAMSDKAQSGVFILEKNYNNGSIYDVYSFGNGKNVPKILDGIVYMIPTSYNGTTTLDKGTDNSGTTLYVAKTRGSDNNYWNGALYSFILFNRTLTNDEIEWVKDNLIEGTYRNPEALLIDAWIFSGHTNEEAPAQITGEKGTALNCYNFAWNEDGSGFKEGFLCFDGVNDRLQTYKHLPLLKTVIAKYVIPKQTYNNYECLIAFADEPNKYTLLNCMDYSISKTQLGSNMSGYGYLAYNFAEDEVHTDYLNTYGRNGEPYIKNDTTEMKDTYQITMGCIYNNMAYMQSKIAYAAIYSESLTDAECMTEIQRLNALWESRKQ